MLLLSYLIKLQQSLHLLRRSIYTIHVVNPHNNSKQFAPVHFFCDGGRFLMLAAMLKETEKRCCQDLLKCLNDWDLQCLAHTVTQNVIAVECRQEAIDAILQCSSSANELLRRQKLKKEHLRDYLIKFGDKAKLPKIVKADKDSLIKMVLKMWSSHDVQVNNMVEKMVEQKETEAQTISLSFVSWFYQMLNAILTGKVQSAVSNSTWGPNHFWNDAKLILHIERPDGIMKDESEGSSLVSERLLAVVIQFRIYFNPNMNSQGIRGEMNCHGLLAVKAAGTLHNDSNVIGLFEQVFGLVRDPQEEGNWKIKNTELRLCINSTEPHALTA